MTPSDAILRIGKILKIKKTVPTIVKPELLGDPFTSFYNSAVAKEIRAIYTKPTNADIIIAFAYASLVSNKVASPFIRPVALKFLTSSLLRSFKDSFPDLVGKDLKRKRFDLLAQASRYSKLETNYDITLDAFVFPKLTLIQILIPKSGNMFDTLAKMKGYAFREVPKDLHAGTKQVSVLRNMPIYQWTFLATVNGVSIYLTRASKDSIAMRLDLTIPFILPLGGINKHTLESSILDYTNQFSIGVH